MESPLSGIDEFHVFRFMEATLAGSIFNALKTYVPYHTACPRLIALLSIAVTAPLPLWADLADDFAQPPESAKPWVFWMWLHTDTTPAAITRDLEQMNAKGIRGFLLYDSNAASNCALGSEDFQTGGSRVLVKGDDGLGVVAEKFFQSLKLRFWSNNSFMRRSRGGAHGRQHRRGKRGCRPRSVRGSRR